MYSIISLGVIVSITSLFLFFFDFYYNSVVKWIGIVAFMITYHLWLRLIMGNITKLFNISYKHFFFKEALFERYVYKLLTVKKWKNKVLTYNPESFDLKKNSLEDIANTMSKSEVDHWVNELISLSSLLFSLLWGEFYIFLITALFAMAFDMQFIIIQRFNRPRVVKIIEKKNAMIKQAVGV